jgi:hypothetical protein
MESQSSHHNEIAGWKAKVRELELDNMQLLEIITKREQALAKVVKEKEYIYSEMVTMRRLHMHLSNRIDAMADTGSEETIPTLQDMETLAAQIEKNNGTEPHYASKLNRDNNTVIRDGNASRLTKLIEDQNKPKVPIKRAIPLHQKASRKDESLKPIEMPESKPDATPTTNITKPKTKRTASRPLNTEASNIGVKYDIGGQPIATKTKSTLALTSENPMKTKNSVEFNMPLPSAEELIDKENETPNCLGSLIEAPEEKNAIITKHEKSRSVPVSEKDALRSAKIQLEYKAYVNDEKKLEPIHERSNSTKH